MLHGLIVLELTEFCCTVCYSVFLLPFINYFVFSVEFHQCLMLKLPCALCRRRVRHFVEQYRTVSKSGSQNTEPTHPPELQES